MFLPPSENDFPQFCIVKCSFEISAGPTSASKKNCDPSGIPTRKKGWGGTPTVQVLVFIFSLYSLF